MADIVDIAQEQEERFRISALSRLKEIGVVDGIDISTPRHCEDCDEQIPIERVKAVPFCTRCVMCQERTERGVR